MEKRNTTTIIISILVASIVVAGLVYFLALYKQENLGTDIGKTEGLKKTSTATSFVEEITTGFSVCDKSTCEILDDNIKIDYITGKENSYTTVIFSLSGNKVLSQKILGADVYSTGILEDGYFVIRKNGKLKLYNNLSEEKKEIELKLTDKTEFCTLTADGTEAVIGEKGKLLFKDLSSMKEYSVDCESEEMKVLDRSGSNICFSDKSGRIIIADASKHKINKSAVKYKNVFASCNSIIEKKENTFIFYDKNFNHIADIPTVNENEKVLTASTKKFITVYEKDNGTMLRIYNAEKKTVKEFSTNGAAFSAKFAPDGNILVGIKSASNQTYNLYDLSKIVSSKY